MEILMDSDGGFASVRFPGENMTVHFLPERGEVLLAPCPAAESVQSTVTEAIDSGNQTLAPNAEV